METREEYRLADLLAEMWRGRGAMALGALICMVLGAAFVFAAVPHGQARMVIAPATPMEDIGRGDVQAEGRIAAAAPQSRDLNFLRFESMMQGASVARLLLRDDQILAGVSRDVAFRFSKETQEWDAAMLADYVAKRVEVDPVGESPLRVLKYEHRDPGFAVLFLKRLHETTDGLIRYAVRKDVNERIEYLGKALGQTLNPEHRRALTDLLMEQERLKMLVSIDQPYAAAIVEPSARGPRPVWPDVPLVFLVSGLVGMFLGFVVFSLRSADRVSMDVSMRQDRRQREFDFDDDEPFFDRRSSVDAWVVRETGNSNERPLTGRKNKKRPKIVPDISSEAAE